MVEVRKTMGNSFKSSPAYTASLSAPDPSASHHQPTPGHSWASLGQSLVGSLILSPGSWYTQGSVCALQESLSPVLCKLWQLCDRVNGDLLQEGLCPYVDCTHSPCICLSLSLSVSLSLYIYIYENFSIYKVQFPILFTFRLYRILGNISFAIQ